MTSTPRRRRRLGALAGLFLLPLGLVAIPATSSAATRHASATTGYLLAVGDSLAAGYQPTDGHRPPPINPATGLADQGYPGSYPARIAAVKHLGLINLGCPGETTTSYTGTPAQKACATGYAAMTHTSNQQAAALAEIAAHPGAIRLVTFDLGTNDLDGCLSNGSVSPSCLATKTAQITGRLPKLLDTLRGALAHFDPGTRIVAMTYYDPYLALAYSPGGLKGTTEAALSLGATQGLNTALTDIYHRAHVTVAEVGNAFALGRVLPLHTYGGRTLPTNVWRVCTWTWMCPLPVRAKSRPAGNVHPRDAGYAAIARAFLRAIG